MKIPRGIMNIPQERLKIPREEMRFFIKKLPTGIEIKDCRESTKRLSNLSVTKPPEKIKERQK